MPTLMCPECSGHKGLATDSGKSSTASSNKKARIPVNNARKIWGTLRSTACSAVTSAIKRLTSAPLCEKLTVKRKFRSSQEGSIKKWWFVVRGNQPDLRILEEEWHKIEIQTGWKLEPVFQFDNSAVDEALSKVKPGSPTMTLPQQLPNVSLQVPQIVTVSLCAGFGCHIRDCQPACMHACGLLASG